MTDERVINPDDLVLQLSEETNNFDISKYEDFIIEFCGERDYQVNCVRKIVKLFLSEHYENISELLEENYHKNETMQEFFSNSKELTDQLTFPTKLSCTIDLATGTGKTWVMYAVARIMLAEGLVDRVLVLCPSLTIKKELHDKFRKFSSNSLLTDSLPPDSKIKNPGIIDSSETIEEGDICIDNIHRAYEHVSSSIEHSLKGNGGKTLVINDEAHHLINPKRHAGTNEKKDMLEWENFLKNPDYGFYYILNSSGTPYKGNNYFKDVIYRYGIRRAIEDEFVKDINYLEKDESKDWDERLKAILNNHEENKETYPEAKKHITIFVTDRIVKTDRIAKKIRDFLQKEDGLSQEQAEQLVIPVTSSGKHEDNRKKLEDVDKPESPVEWIVSVSMLTEGWDVDNVFQIVPHEDRAFNSKLLISQVLGRGLRVPPEYRTDETIHPQVVVFNHEAWSDRVDDLVHHVAEITKRIKSRVDEDSKHNFSLQYMDISKEVISQSQTPSEGEISLPESLGFQSTSDIREQIFKSVKTEEEITKRTKVDLKKYELEEAVRDVHNNIRLLDIAHGSSFSERADKEYIRDLMKQELEEVGEEKVMKENLQRAKSAFNVLYRKFTGQSQIAPRYSEPKEMSTEDMRSSSMRSNQIVGNSPPYGSKALLFSEESLQASTDEELEDIEEARAELEEHFIEVDDELYQTPTNITFLSSSNEIEFGNRLIEKENAEKIDAWVKSRDKGFFSIPYIHRPGTHSLQRMFNPDFIIKKGDKIIIVEIKEEGDTTVENRDKLVGAEMYIDNLNKRIKENGVEKEYDFHFLSSSDFSAFFEKVIRENKKFRSGLHAELSKMAREELK